MPITKSAEKHARQSLKHYKRNLRLKRRMKTDVKALIDALNKGSGQKVADALKTAQSSIDKAAKNHLMHANKAARQKSRLAKLADTKAGAKPATKTTAKPTVKKTAAKKPAVKK